MKKLIIPTLLLILAFNLYSIYTNSSQSYSLDKITLINQAIADPEGGEGCEAVDELIQRLYYEECGGGLISYEHYEYHCVGSGLGACSEGSIFFQYDYVDCEWNNTEIVDLCQSATCI